MTSLPHTDEVYKEKRKPKNPIKFGIALNEEQKLAKAEIRQNHITAIKGKAGSGKAQDVNSLVITPEGTKRIGDIIPGDIVISEKGEPIKVLDIFPQGKKDLYKITFSDGFSTTCCEEHLWTVIRRNNFYSEYNRNGKPNPKYQQYETLSLKEIVDSGVKMGKRDKYFIPQHGITQFNPKEVKIDPYILGCLIGDGSLTSLTPELTTKDEEIVDYFQTWCEENNLNLYHKVGKNKKGDRIQYSITSRKNQITTEYNTLTDSLREYKLMGSNSFTKFIPKDYLFNSKEVRIKLLQGLMDTDGWIQVNNFRTGKGHSSQPYYCTVSQQLKDDFVFLIQSLGGICYVSEKQGKYKAKGDKEYKLTAINYRICVNLPNELRNDIFYLSRKKEKITEQKNILNRSISKVEFLKNDEAVCILVDSPTHLYLTDNFIVTHNTMLAVQTGLDLLFTRDVEKLIIARPYVTAGEDIGFLPGGVDDKLSYLTSPIYNIMYDLIGKPKTEKLVQEGEVIVAPFGFLRGNTFSNCFVMIDEAQNATMKQTELMIGRLGMNSKMVFCGDMSQCDLKNKKDSGFDFFLKLELAVSGVKVIHLEKNHRHNIVDPILDVFATYRD